jgi:hypothetical protein
VTNLLNSQKRNEKNLKNQNTTKISTIALILLLTISATLIALPSVTAQTTKQPYPYLGAVPNPVGTNQEVLLHIGITDSRSSVEQGFDDLTVTVTRPDGQIETLGPFRTDSTGGTGTIYIPTLVGTYQMQTNFPEQIQPVQAFFSPFPTNITYLAATSDILELEVLADPVPVYPGFPLPTEYWTRPIDGQLREWSAISGSWLANPENLYAPYNDAPESAHILWAKPFTMGGLVGGDVGPRDQAYTDGDAYQGRFNDRVVVSGILVYNRQFSGFSGGPAQQGMVAIDIHTGEELWFKNGTRVAFGQTFYFSSQNQHGAHAYVWDNNWNAYYAYNGEWAFSFENVPSGTQIYGPNGEILRYRISGGRLLLWNSTAVTSGGAGFQSDSYTPDGTTHNASTSSSYSWNVSYPTDIPTGIAVVWHDDRIIGTSSNPEEVRIWGVDLRPGHRGELLFDNTWQAPASWQEGNVTVGGFGGGFVAFSQEDRVGVIWVKEFRQHYGFSLETGDYLWGPSAQEYYLNALEDTIADMRHFAYGKMYCASVSGIVYAYDAQTGDLEWTYEAEDPYSEILWANNWWLRPVFISDGKLYVGHGEHSAIDPKPRGAPFICLNATNGDVIWRINGAFRQTRWGGRAVLADSTIITQDLYDQRIYAIGKGPSETTVKIQNDVIKQGNSVMVKGSVMDVSPGTKDEGLVARFPSGVPAVSVDSMNDWMLYVYKQFPRPTNTIGVPVKIQIYDPMGNYAWIGTATTDSYGNYQYSFIPQMEGTYAIIATFDGSVAYYGSTQMTYLKVDPAPAPYPTIPPYPGYQGPSASEVAQNVVNSLPANPTSDQIGQAVVNQLPDYPEPTVVPEYTMIDIVLIVLVAVAIIIGLVSILMLRKQK